MYYGVSYYPEHRDRAQMLAEIKLMQDAGINTVRMGEFAWCRFEPQDGAFDFAWMDEAVGLIGRAGMKSILCTPTACPPAWLVEKHPEIMYVDNRGVTRPFGGRRHYCYNSPVYRQYSERIAEEIGRRYGSSPDVLAFQIDNEPAQEGTGRCHCPACRQLFRQWLESRFGTIGEFNGRAGTIFWGQTYDHFGQIGLPVNTIEVDAVNQIGEFYENPTLRLEYERFCSQSQIGYQNIQLEALKRHTDKPVTTNGTGLATNSIDYYQSFRPLDAYAFDYYPGLRDGAVGSFPYAFGRGVKDKPFWVLEFVSGGGHRLRGSGRLQPWPGALRQGVLHAFAAGAEMLLHFQFRTFPMGAEQLNYAILDADGEPRRRYFEMQETARDLEHLRPLLTESTFDNKIALCFDYDTLWAHRIKPINSDSFDYAAFCAKLYNLLLNAGFGVDVVSCKQDLSPYKLVILPAAIVMGEGLKERLKAYAAGGGTVLATFLTGVKNEDNVGLTDSLPCGLIDLFGVVVSEVEPVFPASAVTVELKLGSGVAEGMNRYWTEALELHGAEAIGWYRAGFRQGQAMVSNHQFGQGKAIYLGAGLDDGTMAKFLADTAVAAGIPPFGMEHETGVEIIHRVWQGRDVCFAFNFLTRPTVIRLPQPGRDELSGQAGAEFTMEPKGCAAIVCDRAKEILKETH